MGNVFIVVFLYLFVCIGFFIGLCWCVMFMEFNSFLYGDVVRALESKGVYEDCMRYVCGALERLSPCDNRWYFNSTGFVCVDVVRDDYDVYLDFLFELVGCSHCYLMNGDGFTLMVSLGSLCKGLENLRDGDG